MNDIELAFIAELTQGCVEAPNRNGVGDDCALLSTGAVVTSDAMVSGVHFDDRLTPEDVGWKLIACNVSDVCSMGRLPEWATLTAAIPDGFDINWIKRFRTGMRAALSKWNIDLVGGDVVRSSNLIFSITMGSRNGSKPIFRSGAQIGDGIWVTGYIGEASVGFHQPDNEMGSKAFKRPEPPVEVAEALGKSGVVHSMIDLSDGLHMDLKRLCDASGVGAVIYPDQLPIGPAITYVEEPLPHQVAFGEDYELLFTTLDTMDPFITAMSRRFKARMTKIGKVMRDKEVVLKDKEWPAPIFQHFNGDNSKAKRKKK